MPLADREDGKQGTEKQSGHPRGRAPTEPGLTAGFDANAAPAFTHTVAVAALCGALSLPSDLASAIR